MHPRSGARLAQAGLPKTGLKLNSVQQGRTKARMKVKQYEMVIADSPHEMQRRVEQHLAAGWDLVGQMWQRPDGQLVREMVLPEHVGEVWRAARWEKAPDASLSCGRSSEETGSPV